MRLPTIGIIVYYHILAELALFSCTTIGIVVYYHILAELALFTCTTIGIVVYYHILAVKSVWILYRNTKSNCRRFP